MLETLFREKKAFDTVGTLTEASYHTLNISNKTQQEIEGNGWTDKPIVNCTGKERKRK